MTLTADSQHVHLLRPRPGPGAVLSRVRPRDPARRRVRLLRSASVRSRSPTTSATSPASRSRPARSRSGATGSCCPCRPRCSRAPEHRARADPADQGRPARRRAGHPQPLGQGRHRQPDALVQGPGGRGGPGRRPRAGLPRAVLPVHRQPGQRGGRGRRPRRLGLGGAHPVVAGAGQGADDRRVRRHAARRRRQLRRREPARHRAGRRARGLGVRERQRRPVLRGGLQDPRLRGRRAARLAAARADRGAGGVRLAADQGGQGLHRARQARAGRAPRRTGCSARRPPAARRSRRRSRTGHDVVRPGAAGHHRPLAGHRQPGRRALRARRGAAHRRRAGARQRRRGGRGHPAAGRRPRACSPRPPAGSPWPPPASWSQSGQLDPDAETVLLITGDGLKTLDAVAGQIGPTATVPSSSKAVREALGRAARSCPVVAT